MTIAEFKIEVQSIFPILFADTFMYADDATSVDKILDSAILRAKSRYQKIESVEVTGTTVLPNAKSVLQCVPAESTSDSMSIWNFMPDPRARRPYRAKHFFDTQTKKLIINPEEIACYVKYVRTSESLTIEDFNGLFTQWAIDYADALLKVKEGYLGTNIQITELPFDMNYGDMLSEGQAAREKLNEDLKEMHAGVLAIRSN